MSAASIPPCPRPSIPWTPGLNAGEICIPIIRRQRLISFTADAGGVTPITLVDNGAELSGTARLDGTVGNVPGSYAGVNLELNLDAYTSDGRR